MKAVVNNDGSFSVEVEGGNTRELFEEIGKAQEVFGNLVCRAKIGDKLIESSKIKLQVRTDSDDNKYYEAICIDTNPSLTYAKYTFGSHKKGGGLFPKHRNWVKWDSEKKAEIDLMTGKPVEKKNDE